MTDKSDAQLDAEAAVPLAELIRKHRIYYQRDIYIPQLTTEDPPVFTNPDTGERTADEMSMLGPTLSWPLESYVSEAYGGTFLWSRAAFAQWANCRRYHAEHAERPEFEDSLCKLLVGLVIRQGYSLERACIKVGGVEPERTGHVLRLALRGIDSEMKRLHDKAEYRSQEDAGLFVGKDAGGRWAWDGPPPEHHIPSVEHIQECPNPICREMRSNAA